MARTNHHPQVMTKRLDDVFTALLMSRDGMTSMELIKATNQVNPRDAIYDLRRLGHEIEGKWVSLPSGKRAVRWRLVGPWEDYAEKEAS